MKTVFGSSLMLAAAMQLVFLGPASAADDASTFQASFQQQVRPFLDQHCLRCHNVDNLTSGVRVDHLDAGLEERHLKLWGAIARQVAEHAMPPDDEPQPSEAERQQTLQWIEQALQIARARPTPKNGSVRRLTVAQYRHTLRDLLLLEDDLADVLPADAISRDGFVNNQETLALSPLLLEAYIDIAEKALSRSIVDPDAKPTIQNFRVELGKAINRQPCPDKLILGADSVLLDNEDFVVTQLTADKTFEFDPFFMRTRYRFIEGYQGNDTVRGWREYDSIYHSVFACMRGIQGYPKGRAYSTVPGGLLLRPAIPSAEVFGVESTYGPRANFKISLRELPDDGRFRVTVTAAKYNDGLLLDPGTPSQASETPEAVVCRDPGTSATVEVAQPGIYQVDVHTVLREVKPVPADSPQLADRLVGAWRLDGDAASTPEKEELAGALAGDAKFVESPFGKAVELDGDGDAVVIPRQESMNVGDGDFTVAAWINPKSLRQAGIVCLGKYSWTQGWYLDMPDGQGTLRIETAGPDNQPNGTVASPPGTLRADAWQHVAAVVRRGENRTELFVNGWPVARGTIGSANLDNPHVDLHLGRIQDAQQFAGQLDEVRIYRRALDDAELQALVEPGRSFVRRPPETPQELALGLGERQFSGTLHQPAFLAVRLPAGKLPISVDLPGIRRVERIVLTPLVPEHDVARRFSDFEKRCPRVGVHLGLRRDCGSTLTQVGSAQTVCSDELKQYVFEGAIRNFPSPDVEKDNVNYLAGMREIGVRSEYTDGRDMPRLLIQSVEFEGPVYETWPPESHRNIFVDFDRKDDRAAHARHIIRTFAARAFRRPITAAEETALVGIYEDSLADGKNFYGSVQDALLVVLTSPQFLLLTESSSTPEPEALDGYELASKLSYFLWNSPPDARLLELATDGSLPDQLDAEIDRLIDDARFARFTGEFIPQWLALEKFAVLEPDRQQFPKLTRDVRNQLRREPVELFAYLVHQNLPMRHLIQSDFVMANEVVASYYDLGDKVESGFDFVPVEHKGSELGGVLTQAAIMAGLSNGRESNPVKRGAWLARRIIAEPPDDPPPNVPMLKEESGLTLRQRLEQHRNQPGCAQCHSKIDPWGLPFEELDAGGRPKRQTVDATSTLPDKTQIHGVNELKRYLAEDRLDQVAFSVLKHLATYACARTLTFNELEYLQREAHSLRTTDYRMRDMIHLVVHSPMFLEK